MLGKIRYHFWSAVFVLGSIYFFYEHQYFSAVILLIFGAVRLFRTSLHEIAHPFQVDRSLNFQLDIRINLDELIKHESLRTLHSKISKNKTENFEDWGKRLIENYKAKTPQGKKYAYAYHEVKYNVRNGVLYKDDKIEFLDAIYDEVLIPIEAPHGDKALVWDAHTLKHNITVRILVVNGALNLEIGRYDKESSPKVYRDGRDAYEHFTKITSFPIMLTCWAYGLPSKFLCPHFEATKRYKEMFLVIDQSKKRKKAKASDWREFHRDLAKYEVLVADHESPLVENKVTSEFENLVETFQSRARKWLIEEQFSVEEFDPVFDRWGGFSRSFNNKFLYLNLMDWNQKLGRFKGHSFADHWEESL